MAERRAINKFFGKPEITLEEYDALQVIPEDAPGGQFTEFVFKDFEIRVYTGNKIKKSDFIICNCMLGRPVEYVPHTWGTQNPIYLPKNYDDYKSLFQKLEDPAHPGTHKKLIVSNEEFGILVSLFTIYPIFEELCLKYANDKDTIVAFDANRIPLVYNAAPGLINENDVKATIHLMILMMGKSFTSNANQLQDHISNYMANRLRAIQFALRDSTAKFLLERDNLQMLNNLWNTVPKLKLLLFRAFNDLKSHPEISTALNLLHEASMSTIKCMQQFISTNKLSKAHAYPEIWSEVRRFTTAINDLKREMGDSWVFYRILRPDDTTLSSANFPNLSRAAVIYAKTFLNTSQSFQRLIEPNHQVEPGLDQAAREVLPEKYLKKK